jgi:hypothetical protein
VPEDALAPLDEAVHRYTFSDPDEHLALQAASRPPISAISTMATGFPI